MLFMHKHVLIPLTGLLIYLKYLRSLL